MEQSPCTHISLELRTALSNPSAGAIDPTLVAHIINCASCRGVLLVLMVDLFNLPIAPQAITCEHCQEYLPSFIDRELEVGAAAAHDYPDIWLHLWTCEQCVAAYDFIRGALAMAPLETMRMPTQTVRQTASQRVRLLHLSRRFLVLALPLRSPLLGIARGDRGGPVVISEGDTNEGRSIRMSVEEQADHNWRVLIEVSPSPTGYLVVQLGDQQFRAQFDTQGQAVIANIPAELLMASDGPGLTIELENET